MPRERLGLASPSLCEKSIIAVIAPTGFGKTALLGQWRREALAHGAVVAWLNVDQWDDDARLAEGLEVALQSATGRQKAEPGDLSAVESQPQARLSRWLAEVLAFAGQVVLILDDVHSLPAATATNSLAYLLQHAPPNLRVLLASRKPLAFPVTELIAHGCFAAVDAASLCLDPQETSAILTARFETQIDADLCAQIYQLTEGWPLGLQLILASLEKRPNLRAAIAECRASRSGDIRQYFVESLSEGLPADEFSFLVCISFVDALHPELCQAITGRQDSARMLAHLCDEIPVLMQSSDSPWLRLQPMAKAFLREYFEALPAVEQSGYRGNAVRWLAAHKHYEEAARHARLCGQDELSYELAERCLYDVLVTGQISRVAEWIKHIPAAELASRPRLCIAFGWTLAHGARNAEVQALIGPILEDPAADAGDRFESALLLAAAAIFADDFDRAQALISSWPEHFVPKTAVQQLVFLNLQAILALYRGQPEQARYILSQSLGDDEAGGAYARTWRDWLVATSYLWQGQVAVAEQLLRSALAEAESIAGRHSPLAAMIGASLAAALWERSETAEIAALLAGRGELVDRATPPECIALNYLTAARMALLGGDNRLLYDLLERLFVLGENRSLPRLCLLSLVEQIRIAALQGRETSCAINLERLDRLIKQGDSTGWGMLRPLVELQVGMAHAYSHVASGDWPKVREVLASIKPLTKQLRRNRDWLQILLLEALAAKHCGEDSESLFIEGLYIVDALGLRRLLIDTHPEFSAWALQVRNDPRAQRLLAASPAAVHGDWSSEAQPAPKASASTKVAPSILLTIKEREVIGLVARNMSNKEIAVALDLSVQTVKWHLKKLFGKLDAGSRKHLIDRARLLGIID
ncbi:LuxR C-terminal-related transcriptional regulator [Pseudomonas sp. N040]|uniref:LuxR C-terminal-related transcriptional regulator n=1 Tax=Pseudomonas sp. N040 TaxID=2785325 RepID=UPI0018A2E5B3|nr:LuxR C-terminal-related transcriptional regulator [Pseudomonas sp. N040]MBF7729057.1 AAA family ATPase [Pseudomonas sp. N040]MBW7012697.1 LuxR C-terminal-related transcriptional regulator [Pseudomonas sp. N040]